MDSEKEGKTERWPNGLNLDGMLVCPRVNRESVTRRMSALPPNLLYDSCAGAREACREVVFSGNLASVKAGLKRHSP